HKKKLNALKHLTSGRKKLFRKLLGFSMSKYSNEFKLMVVKEWLSGQNSLTELVKKYAINNDHAIREWRDEYLVTGSIGSKSHKSYSSEFKMTVLNYLQTHSQSEAARHFAAFPSTTIGNWLSTYRKFGYNGLKPKTKGRQPIMGRKRIHPLTPEQQELADLLTLVGLKRSTYYYLEAHPLNTSSDNKIADVIRQIKSPQFQTEYGYRRVTTLLHDQGYLVNHKRVRRIMRQNALLSTTYNTRKCRYNLYRGTVGRIAERVIKRDFQADAPYQKIFIDVTEIQLNDHNKAYLTAFVDLYAGEVLSYHLAKTPTMALVMRPLKSLSKHRGAIIHSDQGFHYQTPMFINTLKDFGMTQSMSRKSTPVDNAPIESFFHILKANIVHHKQYESFHDFKVVVDDFINYYNNHRIKQKLNGLSPVQYRQLTTESVS
ncbi:IS3 family transposase, partial [Leuconostoc falkenbergense]|uniref:IS3 family transposase n=1 Tax=Leuconostoc falkenbergense TaxID=2766470 RepID=UPI003F982EE6